MRYGRLTPTELKVNCHPSPLSSLSDIWAFQERVDEMGHVTFAVLFTLLDLGVIIVRISGIFALSDTPALAVGLVFITMLPLIFPLLEYPINILKSSMSHAPRDATGTTGTV